MAWCTPCERYLTPAVLAMDGACPTCGGEVQHPLRHLVAGLDTAGHGGAVGDGCCDPAVGGDASSARVPWHFWLLVTAAAVYLGWRVVQGIALLVRLVIP